MGVLTYYHRPQTKFVIPSVHRGRGLASRHASLVSIQVGLLRPGGLGKNPPLELGKRTVRVLIPLDAMR